MARRRAQTEADREPREDFPGRSSAEPAAAPAKISKADAVRAALKDGIDTPDEGIAYILKKFAIEMGKPMWSSYRSQEKARLAKKGGAEAAKPGRKPGAPAAVTPAPLPNGSVGLAIQVEAIKTLVDQLGVDQVVSIARLFAK